MNSYVDKIKSASSPTTLCYDLCLNRHTHPWIADILKPLIRLTTWVACGNIPVGRIPETIVIGASRAKSDFKRTGDIMKAEICHCFIDANTFLHYKSFMEVNWCQELDANRVILVVCTAVLRALDEKKFSGSDSKVRKRARKIISKLREVGNVRKQVEIRRNVELLFVGKEPNINWVEEGLSSDLPDDRIIATVLNESVGKDKVVLLTADLGLQLKAESKGIHCHTLPDNLQLKPRRSPEEEELSKLREKLSHLENRLPVLNIKLSSEDGLNSFKQIYLQKVPALSSADIDTRLTEIRKKFQYSPPDTKKIGSLASVLSGHAWPSQQEIDRYTKDVKTYIGEFRDYLKKEWEYRELRSRTIDLRFVLVNEGNSPAEDIDVFLYVPEGLEICDADNLPEKPTLPDEPVPPRTINQMLEDWTKFKLPLLSTERRLLPRDVLKAQQAPRIRKIKSYEVKFSWLKLKHGMQIEFDPVYAIFPAIESARSFKVDYSLLAGNLPEEIKGQVHIVLKAEGL